MDLPSDIKSMLTAMLELEMIQWDGKELKNALKYKSVKDLTDYARKLIKEKEMNIEINIR